MSERIEEGISKWLFGAPKKPRKDTYVRISDKIMDATVEMEKFLNNISDDRTQQSMKKNISMIQSLMVDNASMYDQWVRKQQ